MCQCGYCLVIDKDVCEYSKVCDSHRCVLSGGPTDQSSEANPTQQRRVTTTG